MRARWEFTFRGGVGGGGFRGFSSGAVPVLPSALVFSHCLESLRRSLISPGRGPGRKSLSLTLTQIFTMFFFFPTFSSLLPLYFLPALESLPTEDSKDLSPRLTSPWCSSRHCPAVREGRLGVKWSQTQSSLQHDAGDLVSHT
jgi:hypothetical protein